MIGLGESKIRNDRRAKCFTLSKDDGVLKLYDVYGLCFEITEHISSVYGMLYPSHI